MQPSFRLLWHPIILLCALLEHWSWLSVYLSSHITFGMAPLDACLGVPWFVGVVFGLKMEKRRGEMGLYVLPKALRTCLPDHWLKAGKFARIAERCASASSCLFIIFPLTLGIGLPLFFQFHHYSQRLSTILSHCVASLDGLCHSLSTAPTLDFGNANSAIRVFLQPPALWLTILRTRHPRPV